MIGVFITFRYGDNFDEEDVRKITLVENTCDGTQQHGEAARGRSTPSSD